MKHLNVTLYIILAFKPAGICVNKVVYSTDLIQLGTVVDEYSFVGGGTQSMLSNSLCCFMGDQLYISRIKN